MQMQLERTEQELQVRNYSPKTVKSYLYGLREYFGFKKINLEILDILCFPEKKLRTYCSQPGIQNINFYYRLPMV